MRRLLRAFAALSALPLAVLPATASSAAPLPPATYLALGDSVAAGVGASRPDLGYVSLVAGALGSARQCGDDGTASCLRQSMNLSVSGATTATLIADQLPAATALLQERNGNPAPEDDVRLITLTIGGNDVFSPVLAACQNPTAPLCSSTVARQLQQVATNYAVILERLRAAAGRGTTIAVTTYYNGLAAPGCPAAALSGLAEVVLEGGPGVPAGLNDIIRRTATTYGGVVVETAPVVQPAEIRSDCLHPTDRGHADIAGAVTDVVLSTVVAGPGGPGPTPTPTPVAPQIHVDRTVIDVGDVHRLTVTGRAGAAVELFGNGRVIRTATIPASGQSSWDLQPGDRTLFFATVGGVRSQNVTVRVRRTVSIGVRQANGIYTFTGQVARAEAGLQVTIARLDSRTNRVAGVASARTGADGRYTIRTALPVGFAGYFALTAPSATLEPGRSRLYGLIVPGRATPPPASESITLQVRKSEGFYDFSGLVSGEPREVPVTLGRLVDGRLIGVRGGLTDSTGGYSLGVALRPGTYFFQVVTATARSRVHRLVVT